MEAKQRIIWIDVLKGFLFTFVILGHYRENIPIPYALEFLDFMRPWRVPAYFFISGFLFSIRRYTGFADFCIWKTKTIFLPYVCFSILFLLLDWNLYIDFVNTLKTGLFEIFVLGKSSPKGGPMWFILTLYLLSLSYYPIYKYLSRTKQIFLVITFSIIGWQLHLFFVQNSIPNVLGLTKVISCMPFFILGSCSKDVIKRIVLIRTKILISIILLVISYISYSLLNGDIFWGNNTSFFSFYLPSLSGVYGIVIVFSAISQINVITKYCIIVSRNALILLATHGYILICQEVFLRNYVDLSSWTFFIGRTITLILIEIFCICFFNRYLFRFMGKTKKNFKESFNYQ